MSRFVDGAPLDASILASLENQITDLKKDKLEVGLLNSAVKKQIQAGKVGPKMIESMPKTTKDPAVFDVKFVPQFSTDPYLVATLVSPEGGLVDDNIRIAIGDVNESTAKIYVYFQSTGGKSKKSISINWIAMTM